MARIIKNNFGNFLVILLIFGLVATWVFSGRPQIWKNPPIPPKIQEAQAAVSFIGASTVIYTNGGAPTAITPHASTQDGDLLVFYHYSRATGGNETVAQSSFNFVFNSVTANYGLVAVGWRIKQSGDTTFTATITNHTSGTTGETVIEWIETYRGFNATNPIVNYTAALSTWASSATVFGPISAPATATVHNDDMVVVFGRRFENVTGQTVLSGDNLTWATRTTANTNLGSDAGAVTQNGLNSSGSNQTVTAKTITTTGMTGAGAGRMFIIEKLVQDSDGNLVACSAITEPVAISSIADTVGERVGVFDFTISDAGTSDGLALTVSQIVLHTSGTGTFSDLTWQLQGPDADYVTGTVGAGTITFSGLSISIANAASENYTIYAYFSTSPTSTDGQTFILSVDGDTDLTVGSSGTKMGATSAVNNSTGSTMNVVATKLKFTTQPPSSATTNTDFTGNIVVAGTDVNNNVDKDFTEDITLSAVIDITHAAPSGELSSTDVPGGLTKTPTNGTATWTDTKYTYAETIDIKATSSSFSEYSTAVTVTGPTTTVASSVNQPPYTAISTTDIVMGVASISRSTGTGQVTAVTLKENSGTIDADTEMANIELWVSSNQTWEDTDEKLETDKTFDGVDGECTFTENFDVTETTKYLIIRADIGALADAGDTIEMQVKDITTTDTKSGLPANIGGTTTVFSKRKQLTFDNSGQAENLTDFPVMVKLTTSRVTYGDFGKADGTDLRFADANNVTELKYHIEKWDNTGDSFIWVKVPQIDASSSTDYMWMYYGYASASDVQDAANTFPSSNNFMDVYHFAETSGNYLDSSSNANNCATVTVTSRDASGCPLGRCPEFNGSTNTILCGKSSTLGDVTVEAWVNTDASAAQAVIQHAKSGELEADNIVYGLEIDASRNLWTQWEYGAGTNQTATSTANVSLTTWTYVAAVRNVTANTVTWYINGVQSGSATSYTNDPTGGTDATCQLVIGYRISGATTYWDGKIDELRVSGTQRTAAWLKASYLSENDQFITYPGVSATITVGSSVAQPPHAAANTTDNVLGVASIFRNTGTGQVTAVTLKENAGTIDAQNEMEYIELWYSSDKVWDELDELIGSAGNFDGTDGEVTFTENFDVSNTTKYLIVRGDIKSGATAGDTIEIQVKTVSTSDTVSGTPLEISGTTTTTVAWWNASWSYRKKLTFDNLNQAENLSNFPVLVKLTTSRITYGDVGKSDGTDLRFLDSDNSATLKYEIERWNDTGDSFIWVKAPQINSSTNLDFIYMYYKNSGAADGQDAPNVWTNGFVGVYHFNEQSGYYQDSATNDADNDANAQQVTSSNNTDVNGLGYYPLFDPTVPGDYVGIPDNASLKFGTSDFTIMVRAKASATLVDCDLTRKGSTDTADPDSWWKLEWGDAVTNNNLNWEVRVNTIASNSGYVLTPDGNWHDIWGTRDTSGGGTQKIYVDGSQVDSDSTQTGDINPTTTTNIGIGSKDTYNDDHFDGYLDEVRYSNVLRTAAWIAADSKSLNDTFLTFGAKETGNSTPTVTNVSLNAGSNFSPIENTTKAVDVTGKVTDTDGCSDVQVPAALVFRSGVSVTCSSDDNNCYRGITCSTSCSGSTEVLATCTSNIWFHADPTDYGAYAAEEWVGAILATDSVNQTAQATNEASENVDIIGTLCLDVTTSVAYGTLAPGTNSGSTNQITLITNTCNTALDVLVSGTDMTSAATLGTIPVAWQHYYTSSFTYEGGSESTLTGSNVQVEIDCPKPTSHSPSNSSASLYWGIGIPASAPFGTDYGGANNFSATND